MTQLKKEFKQGDVSRLRNLITGKYEEATKVVSGYQAESVEHVEGDTWEEDGRVWTIKNGIKQNISKLQLARNISKLPLFCPECNKFMNPKYDEGYYKHFNHCWDCHLAFEQNLKLEGKWQDYVLEKNNAEIDAMIKSCEEWYKEEQQRTNESYVSEMGTVEKWTSINIEQLKQQKAEIIEFLEGLKK